MKKYLRCIRSHKGVNDDECRELSRGYLQCRMDRNLMAPDAMRNLGFEDLEKAKAAASTTAGTVEKGGEGKKG
jgi:cytochrome c oxidase assembly protein subunit 19